MWCFSGVRETEIEASRNCRNCSVPTAVDTAIIFHSKTSVQDLMGSHTPSSLAECNVLANHLDQNKCDYFLIEF